MSTISIILVVKSSMNVCARFWVSKWHTGWECIGALRIVQRVYTISPINSAVKWVLLFVFYWNESYNVNSFKHFDLFFNTRKKYVQRTYLMWYAMKTLLLLFSVLECHFHSIHRTDYSVPMVILISVQLKHCKVNRFFGRRQMSNNTL